MKRILTCLLCVCAWPVGIVSADADPREPSAQSSIPELEIEKLDETTFLHRSFSQVDGFGLVESNGLVVVDGTDGFIVDTPWSGEDTEKLVSWFSDRGYTIKGSISTHFHDDRTAGIGFLNSRSIPTFASARTNALLEKTGRTPARHSFDDDIVHLLNDRLEVFYPGPGHSRDNLVVWLPDSQILFGGCFIRAKETDNLGNLSHAAVNAWSGSADNVIARYGNARLVIPGHGPVGDASLLEHTRALAAPHATDRRRTDAEETPR
ncbi:DIM/SIM/IMP family subclass B1 metallo-beta-lactamase [Gilvimarinus sp. F26214L]|uniref:DIM/SIM/IMP family subclass B1 metallo-beta-lactamase n=1 Tax=Gilvimarinus sp. DZF01 TaxID=3461371 RepID=UPI0040465D13